MFWPIASAARKLTRLYCTVAVSVRRLVAMCRNAGTYMLIAIGPDSEISPRTSAILRRLRADASASVSAEAVPGVVMTRRRLPRMVEVDQCCVAKFVDGEGDGSWNS